MSCPDGGNVEYFGDCMEDRDKAQAYADLLNAKEKASAVTETDSGKVNM